MKKHIILVAIAVAVVTVSIHAMNLQRIQSIDLSTMQAIAQRCLNQEDFQEIAEYTAPENSGATRGAIFLLLVPEAQKLNKITLLENFVEKMWRTHEAVTLQHLAKTKDADGNNLLF